MTSAKCLRLGKRTGCSRRSRHASAPAMRRGKQGERAYCLSAECYPASNRCLIEMLPLHHAPGAEIPKTLFPHRKACLLLWTLWSCGRRASVVQALAVNPQDIVSHLRHSRACVIAVHIDHVGRRGPKYQFQSGLSAPFLEAALACSQLPIGIHAGILCLQPLEQFARCAPRFRLEPLPQPGRDRHERIGPAPRALCLQL